MSTASRSSSGGEGSLRADAREFQPQAARKESPVKPIRTHGRRGDVLASLDAVPFTPSQGVCTPSPTNMAAMWVPHPFFNQHAWGPMGAYAGSPGMSSGGSDSSMLHGSGSQPGTPGGPYSGQPVVWGGYCQPLPYSPTALQIAAASGALGSDPSTPVRGRRASRGGAAASGPFLAVMPGSPMMTSPGHMMFAQYFGGGHQNGSSKSQSPPDSRDSSGSGDEGEGSEGMSSAGSGGVEVCDAARQIATAMCAAQQLPGDPPTQLLELASLLHAYGLVSTVSAFATPHPTAAARGPPSPERRGGGRPRPKAVPKLNPDGSVRLNARQRRTLRRAQERAMKALLEAQTKAHGISEEQAASNLASIGVASMLLGSPPPGPSPVHSPPHMHGGHYAAPPPMALGSGALHPSMAPLDYYAQQPGHAQRSGYEAGMYGVAGGGDMGAHMPMMAMHVAGGLGSPHAHRHPGARSAAGGYSPPGARGYRGAPNSGRMSRFAPQDALAAF